jgi:rhodanese-related sulfurtransferase
MRCKIAGIVTAFFVMTFTAVAVYADETVPRIGQEELLSIIDNPAVAVLDARIVKDWRKSDSKIKGAVRVDPHDVSSWIGNYSKGQKIVVYCS